MHTWIHAYNMNLSEMKLFLLVSQRLYVVNTEHILVSCCFSYVHNNSKISYRETTITFVVSYNANLMSPRFNSGELNVSFSEQKTAM